jgi:hypothetical protein
MKRVYVCIVEDATNKPSNVMGPMSERSAVSVTNGASINLNHADWHIVTIDEDEISDEWKEQAE